MYDMLKIIRPVNFVFTIIIVGLTTYLLNKNMSVMISIYAAFSLAFAVAAGNIINDIKDIDTDKINKPLRGFVSGRIGRKTAVTLYSIFIILSSGTAILISAVSFYMIFAVNILLYLYSDKLQFIPELKNITVALLGSTVFVFPGVISGNIGVIIFPSLFAFLITLIRELIKDVEDIPGDTQVNRLTLPIKYGIHKVKYLTIYFALVIIAACLLSFYLHLLNIYFFIFSMLVLCPLLIYFIKEVIRTQLKYELRRLSNFAKLIMLLGLIGVLIGL